jgi:hypothetical protein
MTNEEKYMLFLEGRMKSATNMRSNSAYAIALDQFKEIFGIAAKPPLPSEEVEKDRAWPKNH